MNKDETPIYEIYVMSEPYHLDDQQFPACGHRERVGYYYEKDIAIRAVEENWCDIQDHYARAAEILEVKPGLYPCPHTSKCLYYLWNQKLEKFEKTNYPKLGDWTL